MGKEKESKNRGQTNRKGNGKGSQKCKTQDPPSKAQKALLKLGAPPVGERQTSVKLKDAMDNKIKEYLDDYRDGNDGRILINMLMKSISLCVKYSL